MTRPDQTRPDQTRPDQTRPDQTATHAQKRKILLVTLYGNFNYGNILQRYALTHILEGYGFEVTHLCANDSNDSLMTIKLKAKLRFPIKSILMHLGIKDYGINFHREKRFKAFQDKFTQKTIFTSLHYALRTPESLWDKYDYAVTGSDQVWHNWSRTQEELRLYYLEPAERRKRVCYAPSFGFSKFPEQDTEIHRKGLMNFDRLSCREQEMQPMIRALTGQEAELVLDPTLLLSPEQWREIASKPEYPMPERYVFCYFLGEITPEYSQVIHDMAGGLPVIDLKHMPYYITHPGEFVYLAEHADFVFTDSFHGTAFSVIFGKNFLAFRRQQEGFKSMFGRIEGILSSTGLMNHIYEPGMTSRPEAVDPEAVREKLNAMRKSSMKYLAEVLKESANDIITENKNTQKGLDKMENRATIDTTRHDTTRHDTTRHDTTRP